MVTTTFVSPRLKRDLRICRQITRKQSTNYYYAAAFLPRDMRPAAYAIYAFLRFPDKIIANNNLSLNASADSLSQSLFGCLHKWRAAYWELGSEEAVLEAAAWVFRRYGIPYQYSEDFFTSLITDAQKREYRDYPELKIYLRGSASLLGTMFSYMLGFNGSRALEYAVSLGEAIRLTEILRDIEADYRLRGKIYLPQDELSAYCISEEDIRSRKLSPRFQEFMRFQVDRALKLYAQGQDGVNLLNKRGRFSARLALALYRQVLVKIKETRYDVFSSRARPNKVEKSLLILKTALTPRKAPQR